MSELTSEEIKLIWRTEDEEELPKFDLGDLLQVNEKRKKERKPEVSLSEAEEAHASVLSAIEALRSICDAFVDAVNDSGILEAIFEQRMKAVRAAERAARKAAKASEAAPALVN